MAERNTDDEIISWINGDGKFVIFGIVVFVVLFGIYALIAG